MNGNRSLPIVIVIVTKDETPNQLRGCLNSIGDFAPVLIVETTGPNGQIPSFFTQLSADYPIEIMPYQWNGQYPKKRQWVLDHWEDVQALRRDFDGKNWVFFIDADERLTTDIKNEIYHVFQNKNLSQAYFISSVYQLFGRPCRFGMRNHKLALFDRRLWGFPVVDDLDCPDMGEIEGHYQPVYIGQQKMPQKIRCAGAITSPMIHLALDGGDNYKTWKARHDRYAKWAAYIINKEKMGKGGRILPEDPSPLRRALKTVFAIMPPALRPYAAFFHSFVLKLGCLDGRAGFILAASRYDYYRRLNRYLLF